MFMMVCLVLRLAVLVWLLKRDLVVQNLYQSGPKVRPVFDTCLIYSGHGSNRSMFVATEG